VCEGVCVCVAMTEVCSDSLRKVCRCSELVKRAAIMLSSASSTSSLSNSPRTDMSTTSRPEDLRGAPASSQSPDTSSSTAAASSSDAASALVTSPRHLDTQQRRPDLDPSSSSQLHPDTHSPPRSPTPAEGVEWSEEAVRPVIRATDALCHVIDEHLSRRDDVTASTASVSSAARRMLPIVPGTAALAGPGLVGVGPGSSWRCQSARDVTPSRHVSMMYFPLTQRTSDT